MYTEHTFYRSFCMNKKIFFHKHKNMFYVTFFTTTIAFAYLASGTKI